MNRFLLHTLHATNFFCKVSWGLQSRLAPLVGLMLLHLVIVIPPKCLYLYCQILKLFSWRSRGLILHKTASSFKPSDSKWWQFLCPPKQSYYCNDDVQFRKPDCRKSTWYSCISSHTIFKKLVPIALRRQHKIFNHCSWMLFPGAFVSVSYANAYLAKKLIDFKKLVTCKAFSLEEFLKPIFAFFNSEFVTAQFCPLYWNLPLFIIWHYYISGQDSPQENRYVCLSLNIYDDDVSDGSSRDRVFRVLYLMTGTDIDSRTFALALTVVVPQSDRVYKCQINFFLRQTI
jgi:hypothetical protein